MDSTTFFYLAVLVSAPVIISIWYAINTQKKFNQVNQSLLERTDELAKVNREIDQLAANKNELFRKNEVTRIAAEQKSHAMTWANNQLEKWKLENETQIRKESKKKSEDIQIGQIYKRLTPFLEEFPWLPSDVRFLGGPIDFVVFEGLSEDRQELNIHLVQVKTGQSRLSPPQKKIREAVQNGKVFWKEIRGDKNKTKPTPRGGMPSNTGAYYSLNSFENGNKIQNRSQPKTKQGEIEILYKSSAQVEENEQLNEVPTHLYDAIYEYAHSWRAYKTPNFKKWCKSISEEISEEIIERISVEELKAIWNKAALD